MAFSSRDKIALLASLGLGVIFGYLALLAPYAGLLIGGFYSFGIIPLVVFYIADQRRVLVWQVCVISLALALGVERVFSGPFRDDYKGTIEFTFVSWIAVSVFSCPTPLYLYLKQKREQKSFWIQFFLLGGLLLGLFSSLWGDPFIVVSLEIVWTLAWFVRFAWEYRIAANQDVPRKAVRVGLVALILVSSIPILTVLLFKQQSFRRAMAQGHYRTARWLVARGADVNGLDSFGEPALAAAAWKGDANGVDALISMGAKVDLEQKGQFRGLWPSGTALAVAGTGGRTEICESLLAAGADVNRKNQYGNTPLLVALTHGNIRCVPTMLDYGADVNVRDALGETPLMLVSQWDPRDPTARHVLEELLARGGDVTAKDDKGQTAEDWAVLYHRKELAERFRKIRESRAEK